MNIYNREQKRRNETTVTARGRLSWLWLLLAFVSTAISLFAPIALIITPAFYVLASPKGRTWVLGALAAFTFLAGYLMGGDLLNAFALTLLVSGAGVAYSLLIRFGFSNSESIIASSVLMALGMFLILCLPGMRENTDIYAPVKEYIAGVSERSLAAYDSLGVGGAEGRQALVDYTNTMLDAVPDITVPTVFCLSLIACFINCLLLHLLNRTACLPLRPLPPFAMWRMPSYFSGVSLALMVAGLVLMLTGTDMGLMLFLIVTMLWLLPSCGVGLGYFYGVTRRGRRFLFPLMCVASVLFAPWSLYVLAFMGSFAAARDRQQKQKPPDNEDK